MTAATAVPDWDSLDAEQRAAEWWLRGDASVYAAHPRFEPEWCRECHSQQHAGLDGCCLVCGAEEWGDYDSDLEVLARKESWL